MPAPIPLPVRQVILKRWQQGESVATLAQELHLSERTVRHLVQRFAKRGQAGLEPDYQRCAVNKLPTQSDAFQQAMAMRQEHPQWGGGLIRIILQEQGQADCPSERTLQRWFRRSLRSPSPPGRRAAIDHSRARQPHEVWQMDAVDQLSLASGQQVSWLRLVDECSGAVLQTKVFPPPLLESGRASAGARHVAPGVFAMGKAQPLSRRQWHPLGVGRRLAHRVVSVVDRPGGGHDLEPSPHAAGQRRGRTVARHGQTLDGTRHVQGRCRTATAHGSHGPNPARGLPQHRRTEPLPSISGFAAAGSALHQDLRETKMGP
jgi:transposase